MPGTTSTTTNKGYERVHADQDPAVESVPILQRSIDAIDEDIYDLEQDVALKLDASSYTAADILAKLLTVDGLNSGLDADLLDGFQVSEATLASHIVVRNAAGGIYAQDIEANRGDNTGYVFFGSTAQGRFFGWDGNQYYANGGAYFNGNIRVGSGGVYLGGGNIYVAASGTSTDYHNDGAWHTFYTAHGNIQIGPANTSWGHIYTSCPSFYFNKPIRVVGTISADSHVHVNGGNLYVGSTGATYLWIRYDGVFFRNTTPKYNMDNSFFWSYGNQSLGTSSYPWLALHYNGALNFVSDAKLKQDVRDLSTAERNAIRKVIKGIKMHKMIKEVQNDPDKAKWKCGIVAQTAAQHFIDEGLDPLKYACFDIKVIKDPDNGGAETVRYYVDYIVLYAMAWDLLSEFI